MKEFDTEVGADINGGRDRKTVMEVLGFIMERTQRLRLQMSCLRSKIAQYEARSA